MFRPSKIVLGFTLVSLLVACTSTTKVTTSSNVGQALIRDRLYIVMDTGSVQMMDPAGGICPISQYLPIPMAALLEQKGIELLSYTVTGVETGVDEIYTRGTAFGSEYMMYMELTEAIVYPNGTLTRGTLATTVVRIATRDVVWKASVSLDAAWAQYYGRANKKFVDDLADKIVAAMVQDRLVQ